MAKTTRSFLISETTVVSADYMALMFEHISSCKYIKGFTTIPGNYKILIEVRFIDEEQADIWVTNLPYSLRKLEVATNE